MSALAKLLWGQLQWLLEHSCTGLHGTASLFTARHSAQLAIWPMMEGVDCRYYVHIGFMMKIMNGQFAGEDMNYEGEVIALMQQAQLTFSLGLRGIVALGLTVSPHVSLVFGWLLAW